MSVIINILDEQVEHGFVVSIYGTVSIFQGEKIPFGTFSFFMMEETAPLTSWSLLVYLDRNSQGVEVDFFPEFYEEDYIDRTCMMWLAQNAEDVMRECRVQEILANSLKQSSMLPE